MSDPIFDKLLAAEQGKAGGPAPGGTVFDSLMGIEQRKTQQLLGQLNQAVGVNPDQYSADRQTAKLLARPVAAVEALPQDAERDAKLKTLQDNTANAPVLRQQYTDADFAKLAHDDSGPLSAIEALVGAAKYVTSAPGAARGGLLSDVGLAVRSIASGAPRLSAGIWGAGAAIPGMLGLTDVEQAMLGQQKNAQRLAARIQGLDPDAGLVERSVMSGFQSAGQNLVMLPFGLARGATEIGTTAILTAMGLSTGGESYGKAREKGLDPYRAAAYGIEDAAAEVVFEKYFGIGGFLQNVKAGAGAGKLFVYELSKELPGEVATTLVQNFNEWMNVNPNKSVAQFISEQPEAIAQTVIATLVGGGTQIGVIKGAEKVLGSFADTEEQIQAAQAQRAMLEQLSTLAQQSKLKARDAETFQRFVDAATDGTPAQELYINANVLMQSGVAEQIAQALPAVAEQLPAALASDGFVRIPTAQYAAVIAGSEFEQAVIDHVKVDPNGYTFAESKEYAASFNQEMQTQLEKAIAAQEGDSAFKAEREQVREQFLAQLNEAKRFTQDVNGAYASMLANFYAVTAAKLGMTPRELVDRYQLNVAGREQIAAQFDQGDVAVTDQTDERTGLPLNADGTVTLYHHTSAERAQAIKESGALTSAGEPDVYVTTREQPDTGYGDTVVRVRVNPERLELDDEFADGRRDYRINVGRPGGSLTDAAFNQPVSTRVPTAKPRGKNPQPVENPLSERLRIGLEAFKDVPEAFDSAVKLLTSYVNWHPNPKLRGAEKRAEKFIDDVVQNLLWLHDQVPEEIRARSKQWYDGANVIANMLAERYGLSLAQTSGILVVNSPQTEWFTNVSRAERILDIYFNQQNTPWSPEMDATADRVLAKEQYAEDREAIRGKTLAELSDDVTRQAMWLRIYDETHNPRSFRVVTPEGAFGEFVKTAKGEDSTAAWANFAHIAKSISIINDGSIANISVRLGNEHKVRSFYNNIYAPNDSVGDVTIDTHAVAAGLLRPLSGSDIEVSHNLGAGVSNNLKGISGTYGIYAEAYRRAAAQRGLLPREMQSITWEAIRGLYTDVFKRSPKAEEINQAWAEYRAGKITEADVRAKITEIAGGINEPNWWQSDRRPPAQTWSSSYGGELSEFRLPRGAAESSAGGIEDGSGSGSGAGEAGPAGVLNQPAAAGPRGQIFFGRDITETPSVIALLKNADLSTFLHESGHFFLQVQADLAARIQTQIDGGASVSDAERSIVEDMAKLLDWMGVKADQDGSALDVWLRMSVDEQREFHEKFARGFEAYAFEGRAPTMELQSIFQRFRAWLLNLYRDLKSLNVQLTDEVRGVMDRMLATNEQIEAAEAARNMGPLFNPQNAQGLIDDWQAYHSLANDATLAAVDELQAKSLKELQWASRARTRVLKDLQKQHNAIRAELKMEARREVMSQPVYRAWQFLTSKLSKEDRAAMKPEAERKSLPGSVDPSIDSLFIAIAKLGGLDRAQVESQWGWDKKERSPSPVFGKPLLRREGGMGLDAMGETLAEYGYLPKDEHGKYDMADFEEAFDAEYRGTPVYSIEHDYASAQSSDRPGEGLSLENIAAGRLDLIALKMVGVDEALIDRLQGYGMTAKNGIHPDIVADLIVDEAGFPIFTSGNELAQRLAEATPPKVAIEKLTDQMMLERFGELATPEAIQRAADEAVHNELRAKMLHAEARALERAMAVTAPGRRANPVLPQAAREFAQRLIASLKIRDIRPAQYAAAEVRAAKAAERAFAKNDLEAAAEQKRVQIVNNYATREAYAAQDEVRSAVAYLRKFDKRPKALDPDYYDQIAAILERFDLVPSTSLKEIDRRTGLAAWLAFQEEQGLVPEIPPEIIVESFRKSYKDMTLEELRGLRDAIKQIDHLGRLKSKLLTAQAEREFSAVRDEMAESIIENGKGRTADNRTPNTVLGESLLKLKNFFASHIKAATWARIMDGGKDGGPVWEYLIRTANVAGDMEVTMREKATKDLSALVAPVLAEGKMGGKGELFPSIGRSLNKEARLAIALNIGNESNLQRLLGGEGWTVEQIKPVLDTLTTADWKFVQAVWDYFESYRPEIGAKQRRVYGTEPNWIESRPLTVQSRDGDTLNLRGGYYPVKYDPRASERAESHMEAEDARRMMQGAYTSATTRRSFTKERSEAVLGRPLLYSLDGLYNGVNEVIHDLSWHEWLIDANRIIKNPKIAEAMRNTYGAEVHQQFKTWLKDVAEGERGAQHAGEQALAWIRQGTSVAGLGINVMSALLQPFGITQSMVRVGAKYVGRGVAKAIADPVGINAQISEMSDFMRTRSLTRMRELAELRNQVKGQTKLRANIDAAAYALMLRAQQLVDVPTWWGAYEKAIAQGNAEERAIALADQAVIDAQGSGTVKDLSRIERGGPALKLFTTFYSFMNTSLNLGVAQAMTRESKARLAADMLLIYVAPVILIELMKSAFTPGDSGDWEDPDKAAMKILKAEVSYLMGLFFGVRELSGIVDAFQGKPGGEYSGPAGTRIVGDTLKLAKQIGQGEMDDGLRKSIINVTGELFRLPAAQVNRSITGAKALAEGDTQNPAALVFGYEEPR